MSRELRHGQIRGVSVINEHTARDRRLAAVVFSDVVGYPAMIHADEATAIARVSADAGPGMRHCSKDWIYASISGAVLRVAPVPIAPLISTSPRDPFR